MNQAAETVSDFAAVFYTVSAKQLFFMQKAYFIIKNICPFIIFRSALGSPTCFLKEQS